MNFAASLPLLASSSNGAHDLPLLTTLATGFAAAWVFGLLTQRLGLSPIVGYLVAGIAIGPHTPGFMADPALAAQLAELGVILLMFGVGMHFHLKDLLAVKNIAVPGALGQSAAATLLGLAVAMAFGWEFKAGLVIGMAMAVASTVVLMRVLMDNDLVETVHGRVAVGWLIVEDILTVVVLVLIPALAANGEGSGGLAGLAATLFGAFAKLSALVFLLLFAGAKIIPRIMTHVARLRSRELFTLTVLVFAITIATISAQWFGVSMALGAFLAGMAVGQSPVSHQAAAEALPLRDAFAVIFFVSIGMLFDPMFLVEEPLLVLAALGIVMIGKPLAAMLIVGVLGYSMRTALVVAIGLAQIGEFSFILAELAVREELLPQRALSMLVAASIISITLNPPLFRLLGRIERALDATALGRFLDRRARRMREEANAPAAEKIAHAQGAPLALIVGYGPAGRTADRFLRAAGLETVVIDMNLDSVAELRKANRLAIYGDASREDILRDAGAAKAAYLVVTLPHSQDRAPLVSAARELNPSIAILARARYLREGADLRLAGANDVCIEELEAALGLARLTLRRLGSGEEKIEEEMRAIRRELEPEPQCAPTEYVDRDKLLQRAQEVCQEKRQTEATPVPKTKKKKKKQAS
jgi:CPA2 family monovalent cation:H+ antiporter-2